MSESLEWMNLIVDPDYRDVTEGKRLMLSRPWQIDSRVMATNGYMIVSVTGSGFAPAPADVTDRLLKVLTLANPSLIATLDAATIREWCGPPEGKKAEDCDICNGSGEHRCDECDAEHECGACKGFGTFPVQSVRNGTIAGLAVDRESLSVPFQHLEGRVLVEKDQPAHDSTVKVIRFAGPDWTVLITVKTTQPELGETWPELLKGATT